MTLLHASASAPIDAPPDKVFAVLADYRDHHPHILPPETFSGLVIEEGGQGAGTVFRVEVTAGGRRFAYHMDVSEPKPGRVLRETDRKTGLQTTFTVDPDGASGSVVQIATEWQGAGGVTGLLERLTAPAIMGRIYAAELERLREYVKTIP